MRRYWKTAAIVAIVAGLTAGFFIYSYLERQTPKTGMELPGGASAEVTPVDKMRERTAEDAPKIEGEAYRLTVTGMVDQTLEITLADLQELAAEERLVDLPCVEGWTETGLWKGPRLQQILDMAGVQAGADNVIFLSPGGYSTSLMLEDIRETDPLLSYMVNGEQLPDRLGFPVRLVVPHRLGYKWIKWVTGIEVIQGDYEGYWESRGYPNEADTSR